MTTSFFPYFPGNSSMSYDQIKQSCPGIAYQWLVFFPKQAPGFSFERLNGKRLLPGLAVAWIGNYSPSQNRPGTASVVSRTGRKAPINRTHQTLRDCQAAPGCAKRLECVRLQRRFPKAG